MQNNRYSFPLLLFILFGIYCFVFGESGILERMRLQKDKEQLNSRIESLKKEGVNLRSVYKGYQKGDYNKKEAAKAGYIDIGGKTLFFKGRVEDKEKEIEQSDVLKKYTVDAAHLRILWLVVSVMIILIYYARRSRYKEV